MAKVTTTIQGDIAASPTGPTGPEQPTAESPNAVPSYTNYEKTLMEADGRIKTSSSRIPWIPNFMYGTNLRDLASDRVNSRLNSLIVP